MLWLQMWLTDRPPECGGVFVDVHFEDWVLHEPRMSSSTLAFYPNPPLPPFRKHKPTDRGK